MKMLKELKWEAILTGVLYILLGIVALVIPETMQKTLGYLIGIVLIVAGLVSIICYLLRDARDNFSLTEKSRKAHFTRVTEVVESCQMCWNFNGMQHICNKYATNISMICIGHFQSNLGMSFSVKSY